MRESLDELLCDKPTHVIMRAGQRSHCVT